MNVACGVCVCIWLVHIIFFTSTMHVDNSVENYYGYVETE